MSAALKGTDVEASLPALRGALLRQVRSRVDSEADAEDVVQELLVRLWDRREGLGDVEEFENFVRRAATNAVRDHYRRAGSRSRLSDRARHEPDSAAPSDAPVIHEPDGVFDRELVIACMRPFLHTLPPAYRQALELTHIAGLSQADAARQLGLSPTGFRSRVQRGRVMLKNQFLACCAVAVDGRGRVVAASPKDACSGC